jgi:hypothetical protein
MLTVLQAFQQFLENLELTESERSEASRQQKVLRDNLNKHLDGITRDILSGSYSRATAIRPLNDIDLFVILNKQVHTDVTTAMPPEQCLKKFQKALASAYPNKNAAEIQGRSVHIDFIGTGIGYDVVPALEMTGGDYMIPDRDRKTWIRTNPEKHRQACIAANERAGGKLNRLIKAAKQWKNRHNIRLLRSFHVEVMAYGAFNGPPPNFPAALQALLEHLGNAIAARCPEPAGVGPHIDAGMPQEDRTRIQKALREAASFAKQALLLDAQGRTAEAHAVWGKLLGSTYPEKG